jgi:hypothetical protein
MVANMLSLMLSRRLQPLPIYQALLHQDGVALAVDQPRDVTAS